MESIKKFNKIKLSAEDVSLVIKTLDSYCMSLQRKSKTWMRYDVSADKEERELKECARVLYDINIQYEELYEEGKDTYTFDLTIESTRTLLHALLNRNQS